MLDAIIDAYRHKKNPILYFLFDLSFLLYLIAYHVYYQDEFGHEVRLVATMLFVFLGILISFSSWRTINRLIVWYLSFSALGLCSMLWAKETHQIIVISFSLIRNLLVAYFLGKRIRTKQDIIIILVEYLIAVLYLDVFVGKLMVNTYTLHGLIDIRFGDNFNYNSNSIAITNVIAVMILINLKCISKYIKVPMMIFYVFIVLITQSKKGILGLLIGTGLLLYIKEYNLNKIVSRFICFFAIILVLVYMTYNNPELYYSIGHRFDGLINLFTDSSNIDNSTLYRAQLIMYAIELWGDNPILGVGLNNFSVIQSIGGRDYYAHNNYVELLADLGLIGFILFYYFPFKLALTKINSNCEIESLLKSIVITILFFDFTSVTYQDFRILLFYMLFYYVLHVRKNKQFIKGVV